LNVFYAICLLVLLPLFSWAQSFEPGEVYFSANEYIEYISGNLPIVISAPHGGHLEPEEIPDRDCNNCVYIKDSYTQELAREVTQAIHDLTGCYPHTIINKLHRKKLDANRDIVEAADGNIAAEEAWMSFQSFIDSSKCITNKNYSPGLYLDIHGHGHDIQRIELGYLISGSELRMDDEVLNEPELAEESSISELVTSNINGLEHSELLRGQQSFGGLLIDYSYPSVPSSSDLFPLQGQPYFSGGYNTQRHKESDWGEFNSIQIECNQDIRFNENAREAFAMDLASVILDFLEYHSFPDLPSQYCNTSSTNSKNKENIEIYPNPATDYLLVETARLSPVIKIYDVLGKIVFEKDFQPGMNKISLSSFDTGIYHLLIFKEKQYYSSHKIVISRLY
jgi:hypothetical protein